VTGERPLIGVRPRCRMASLRALAIAVVATVCQTPDAEHVETRLIV